MQLLTAKHVGFADHTRIAHSHLGPLLMQRREAVTDERVREKSRNGPTCFSSIQ